jgi:hypothetical protein
MAAAIDMLKVTLTMMSVFCSKFGLESKWVEVNDVLEGRRDTVHIYKCPLMIYSIQVVQAWQAR